MIDEKELLYGAAEATNQVKFAFGSGDEKFATAAGQESGVLSFVAGSNGGAVYVGSSLVSSRVLSYAVSTNATGEQVVDVRYIDANNAVATAQVLAVNASFVEGKISALKTAVDSSIEDLSELVGTKAGNSSLESDTVWGALDELAASATGDVARVETHLKSEFVTAADDQAVSVAATGDEYKSFEVGLNLAADEKVLSQTAAGLKTNLGLNWNKNDKKIQLLGANSAVVAEIDATDFVKDGMIDTVEYADGKLTITWNEDGGKTEATVIDLGELFDIENVVVANDSSAFLGANLNASVIELSAKMGDFAAENQVNGLASTSAVKTYVDGLFTDSDAVIADVSADLAAHIAAYTQKMTAVDSSVLENAQAIDAIEAQIDGFDYVETATYNSKMTDVDSSINRLDTSVSAIETQIAAFDYVETSVFETYVSNTSTKLGDVDSSIERLDTSVSAIETQIAAFDYVETATYNSKMTDVDSSIDRLDTSVSAIEAAQSVQDTSINNALTALTWIVL